MSWRRQLRFGQPTLFLLSIALFFSPISSSLVNISVEDKLGELSASNGHNTHFFPSIPPTSTSQNALTSQPTSTASPPSTESLDSGSPQSSSSGPREGDIIAGTILGILALFLATGTGVLVLRRCKRRRDTRRQTEYEDHDHCDDCDGENNYIYTSAPRRQNRALFAQPTVTTIAPLRLVDDVATPTPLTLASDVLRGADCAPHASLPATLGASSSEPSAADPSSRHRAELTQRLETLRRTRSVLSSQAPSESRRSRSASSSDGGMEAVVRDLEAEIAQLRGVLAAMNARFADSYGGHLTDSESLPAYAE